MIAVFSLTICKEANASNDSVFLKVLVNISLIILENRFLVANDGR